MKTTRFCRARTRLPGAGATAGYRGQDRGGGGSGCSVNGVGATAAVSATDRWLRLAGGCPSARIAAAQHFRVQTSAAGSLEAAGSWEAWPWGQAPSGALMLISALAATCLARPADIGETARASPVNAAI